MERKRGLDHETQKALLLKHIADNDDTGSKLDELLQVLPALSRRQTQRLLAESKGEQKIRSVGRTNAVRWQCGPEEQGIAPN